MQSHDHRRARRSLSPEELAATHERALRWREEWRAELAGRDGAMNGEPVSPPAPQPKKRKEKSSAKFAEGIARAEFGRFYWKGPAEKAKSKSKSVR